MTTTPTDPWAPDGSGRPHAKPELVEYANPLDLGRERASRLADRSDRRRRVLDRFVTWGTLIGVGIGLTIGLWNLMLHPSFAAGAFLPTLIGIGLAQGFILGFLAGTVWSFIFVR